jgi:hypothetical protein
VVLWAPPARQLYAFALEHMSLGQTSWYDRSPAEDLADQSINVRQAVTVSKVWESIVADDTINVYLSLELNVWEKCHSKIERI